MVASSEKPAARRQPSTASCSRRFAGPWLVRPSIWPIAQRWRPSAARVESARPRMAAFQSPPVDGGSISPKTMSIIPSRRSLLAGDVVVERHRLDAELVGELAHRQRLEPAAVGEGDRGPGARAPG